MKARQIDILHQVARAADANAAQCISLSAVVAAGTAWDWVVSQTVDELAALGLVEIAHGGCYVSLTSEGRALLI